MLNYLNTLESQKNQYYGLQESSLPHLVILGVAKGGTSELWHSIMTQHPYFQRYSNVPELKYLPVKELNFPGVCASMSIGATSLCNASIIDTLLKCPKYINDQTTRDFQPKNFHKSINNCTKWLNKYRHTVTYNYTIDANPSYLYYHQLSKNYLSQFHKQGYKKPLYIALLREPISKIISLYNHWHNRTNGSIYSLSLQHQLQLELNVLRLPNNMELVRKATHIKLTDSNTKILTAFASFTTLCNNMASILSNIDTTTKSHTNTYLPHGLILDTFYTPQLLQWLYDTDDVPTSIRGRLLIFKSEYCFSLITTQVIFHFTSIFSSQ